MEDEPACLQHSRARHGLHDPVVCPSLASKITYTSGHQRQLYSLMSGHILCEKLHAQEGRMARIVVTDDDTAIRETLALAVTAAGHEVQTARTGVEEIELLRRSPDSMVVLLDLM